MFYLSWQLNLRALFEVQRGNTNGKVIPPPWAKTCLKSRVDFFFSVTYCVSFHHTEWTEEHLLGCRKERVLEAVQRGHDLLWLLITPTCMHCAYNASCTYNRLNWNYEVQTRNTSKKKKKKSRMEFFPQNIPLVISKHLIKFQIITSILLKNIYVLHVNINIPLGVKS